MPDIIPLEEFRQRRLVRDDIIIALLTGEFREAIEIGHDHVPEIQQLLAHTHFGAYVTRIAENVSAYNPIAQRPELAREAAKRLLGVVGVTEDENLEAKLVDMLAQMANEPRQLAASVIELVQDSQASEQQPAPTAQETS